MFNIIVLFVAGTLGLVCSIFLYEKRKLNQQSIINKYLLIITISSSIRLLLHGISLAYPTFELKPLTVFIDFFYILLMPLFFLYFKGMVNDKRLKMSNLYHFFAPLSLILFVFISFLKSNKITQNAELIFFYLCILLYLIYVCLTFVLLYKNIWFRKSDIKAVQQQNQLIKNWSMFLSFSFLAMVLVRLILGIVSNNPANFDNKHLWIPTILWAAVFIKIILTPEILYGYNFLNKTIDEVSEKMALKSVWKLNGTATPILSEKDVKLTEKIIPQLAVYIHRIEEISFHSISFRNPELGLTDLSSSLNIPISHLNYIFKYHCNESFSDYKKIVRIHDATKLLEAGFLKDNKIEMLSSVVGFSSYHTFYLAFKGITGITTQEYIKRL